MTNLGIQLYVIYFCKEKFFAFPHDLKKFLNLFDIVKN